MEVTTSVKLVTINRRHFLSPFALGLPSAADAPRGNRTRHDPGPFIDLLRTDRAGGIISSAMAHVLDPHLAEISDLCRRYGVARLEVFGSAARSQAKPDSDVDLLVTFDESVQVSIGELLEMAGEVEELIGRPVDFVLRPSLEKSPNHFAREHILATAVCLYGN